MRARGVLAGLTAMTVAAVTAPTALAATTIGSDLTLSPTGGGLSNATYTNRTVPTGATTPLTSPISGVLVRMRVRRGATGATPGRYAYRILAGAGPSFTARPATVSGVNETLVFPPSAPAAIDTFVPTDSNGRPRGVPIAAGERLGFWLESISPTSPLLFAEPAAASVYVTLSDHVTGSQPYNPALSFALLVQGVVEPDADGDGYGDETQDDCLTDAAKQDPCPPAPPTDNCPGNDQRLDDCTAPVVQIVAAPKPKTKKTAATFTFSSDEESTFECALDKGGFRECESPARFRRLAVKRHTFRVRATDGNGNRSDHQSHGWRVKPS